MERITQPSHKEPQVRSGLCRAMCFCTGDMHEYGTWMQRQSVMLQLVDCVFRGVAQVMFVNNPLSGFLITVGLFVQNPWWGLNGLLGTLVSTMSAVVLLGHDRGAIQAGLYGYNGTLVGMLMAVFSAKGDWYWWLLLPNVFMSMLCPVVSSALSSISSKWDVPVFTLPFNILLCLHLAATGHDHPYFPGPFITKSPPQLHNGTMEGLDVSQLFLAVPVGVSQVYGCDNPWSAGVFLLALLISSPTICLHALLGSAVGVLSGLALAASHGDIYSGLCGYNSALSCAAIGGMFYALTWQTHLLALTCAFFGAYMTAAISNLMATVGLPACTWPFCLSTLIFLLLSSETPSIHRLPLSVVSYPEKNLRHYRELREEERSKQGPEQIYCSGSQSEVPAGVLVEGTPEVPS